MGVGFGIALLLNMLYRRSELKRQTDEVTRAVDTSIKDSTVAFASLDQRINERVALLASQILCSQSG